MGKLSVSSFQIFLDDFRLIGTCRWRVQWYWPDETNRGHFINHHIIAEMSRGVWLPSSLYRKNNIQTFLATLQRRFVGSIRSHLPQKIYSVLWDIDDGVQKGIVCAGTRGADRWYEIGIPGLWLCENIARMGKLVLMIQSRTYHV